MAKLIGLSGSLRSGSYNTALLECAATLLAEGSALEIQPINEIPLYNGDLEENAGMPESVTTLKQAIKAADGLVIATPEYNGSFSSGLKNFIDVFAKEGFRGRPIGVATGSTGAMGGVRAAYQFQQVILFHFHYFFS